MQIRVLIERLAWDSYRVTGEGFFAFTVEADSRDKALALFREKVLERVPPGTEVLSLDIPEFDNPWRRMAGMYKDKPLFEEWQEAMAEYRRQRDEEPDALGASMFWTRIVCPFSSMVIRCCLPRLVLSTRTIWRLPSSVLRSN